MNKQKFEAKCQEIYAYEDEVYERIKEFVKPYNEELAKMNCEIDVMLFWLSPEDNKCETQRTTIEKKKRYDCQIRLQFQIKGVDSMAEDGIGFQIWDGVTSYRPAVWTWFFEKRRCRFIYKRFDFYYKKVLELGLEKASKEILAKENE